MTRGQRVAYADGGPPLKLGTVTGSDHATVTVHGDDGETYRLAPTRVRALHTTQTGDSMHEGQMIEVTDNGRIAEAVITRMPTGESPYLIARRGRQDLYLMPEEVVRVVDTPDLSDPEAVEAWLGA